MRPTNRMLAAGALSVPMALGVSGVAMASEGEAEAEARAQTQAQVEDQRGDENEEQGLLNLGLIKIDDEGGDNRGDNRGEEFLIDLTAPQDEVDNPEGRSIDPGNGNESEEAGLLNAGLIKVDENNENGPEGRDLGNNQDEEFLVNATALL